MSGAIRFVGFARCERDHITDIGLRKHSGEEVSRVARYAVRTVQVSKLGKERFMPEGAVLEEGWEPVGAFFGNMEPWLVAKKKVE